jgi:hypothetical protein
MISTNQIESKSDVTSRRISASAVTQISDAISLFYVLWKCVRR